MIHFHAGSVQFQRPFFIVFACFDPNLAKRKKNMKLKAFLIQLKVFLLMSAPLKKP